MTLPDSRVTDPTFAKGAQAPPSSDKAREDGVFYTVASMRPEESVGYLLRSALVSIRSAADSKLQVRGLTFAQCLPLYKISRCESTTLAALARELDAEPSAVTRLLDRLEAKELVTRERSTTDRRVVHVRTTPLGNAMAQELAPVLSDTMNAHLAGFSHEEWQQLMDMLRRMLANGENSAK